MRAALGMRIALLQIPQIMSACSGKTRLAHAVLILNKRSSGPGVLAAAACRNVLASSTPGAKLQPNSRTTMGLDWASVKAQHVSEACEVLSDSDSPRSKSGSLIVTYRGKDLPAKAVLRLAYCLANNIPSETNLKFSSGEGSIKFLRSLGFQAQRLQPDDPIAEKH
jgi:hypothetical protein